jgi:hypothetical protein
VTGLPAREGRKCLAPIDPDMTSESGDPVTESAATDAAVGDSGTDDAPAAATAAERVTISYPADLSDWGRGIVEDSPFRAYLRRVHDEVRAGDTWPEFVGVGCCGDTLDVPLRVEAVTGGSRVTAETTWAFTERAACDLDGGWQVQSAAGPTE